MKAITELRKQLGLSQEELAQYLSVTHIQVAMYENNRRDLPHQLFANLLYCKISFKPATVK